MITGTSGRRALAFGKSSRPLIPGMLMSERTRMSDTPAASAMACRAAAADWANSMLNRPARRSRRNCCRNNSSTSGSSSTTRIRSFTPSPLFCYSCCLARQNDPEFGELARSRLDLNRPTMLRDNDVVTDRQAKASALAGWLGGEERIEHLLPDFGRNAGTIVAYPNLHSVAKVFGCRAQGLLIAIALRLRAALGGR